MNQRDALRFAAAELADYAEGQAETYLDLDVSLPVHEHEEKTGDRQRVIDAFKELAARMNKLSTGQREPWG